MRQLDRDIRDQIRGLNVVKAKIFLPSGSTVYSTDLGELGRQTASLGFSRALGGEVSSELSFRDEYYALEGYIADRNLVSTYIPVRAAPGAPVQAVFEIYSDVTPWPRKWRVPRHGSRPGWWSPSPCCTCSCT